MIPHCCTDCWARGRCNPIAIRRWTAEEHCKLVVVFAKDCSGTSPPSSSAGMSVKKGSEKSNDETLSDADMPPSCSDGARLCRRANQQEQNVLPEHKKLIEKKIVDNGAESLKGPKKPNKHLGDHRRHTWSTPE